MKKLLTVDLAQQLVGKRVVCEYHDVNHGIERFEIIGRETVKRKQIGQDEHFVLLTKSIDEDGNYLESSNKRMFINGERFEPNNRYYIIRGKFTDRLDHPKQPRGWFEWASIERLPSIDGKIVKSHDLNRYWVDKNGNKCEPELAYRDAFSYDLEWEDGSWTFAVKEPAKLFPDYLNCWDCEGGEVEGLTVIKGIDDWCYEWDGIYRRGSGAERLIVIEILDK